MQIGLNHDITHGKVRTEDKLEERKVKKQLKKKVDEE
jgi:hypothetical protein